MQLTFRWFGATDPIELSAIRQIPGVRGVVSALYDVPVGALWGRDELDRMVAQIDAAGLALAVIESVPVHEDIKLGRPTRDALIESYASTLQHIGAAGVRVVCYNFMPVFDWTRTDLAHPLADGSTALAYDHAALGAERARELPGWLARYEPAQLEALLHAYRAIDAEQLWENLAYFLERVIPAAESADVRLALHPDDPPWPVFGLPRIITDSAALHRVLSLVDSPYNGLTFCTGSLGVDPANDLPTMIGQVGATGRIHFAHCRNVRVTGERRFHETAHPSACGDVDMVAVLRALRTVDFRGPIRPDHGRAIWDEQGRPGYGLYDRALGAMYLYGIGEALGS